MCLVFHRFPSGNISRRSPCVIYVPDVRHCGSSTRLDIDDFLPVLNLAGETICGSSELLPFVEIGKLRAPSAGLDLDEGWIW